MSKGNWVEFNDPKLPNQPKANASKNSKATQKVRVSRVRNKKGGKMITAISGLGLTQQESMLFLKRLKAKLGTGGTVKEECIEIQGDQVKIVMQLLTTEGYRPKQSGS